ncbi:hypothetical protein [Mycolicibacterium fortuitum]|uniref:hypothetical protein n=1 Tax=Mycolicibacterium fortuitum TaxID=1766 RepID=UPI001AF0089F|nr:hypothetical protein [Mycolicibacterium fortuitum]MBP3087378.1 hypothetical protein [Mycolicibacterium fortuitum]
MPSHGPQGARAGAFVLVRGCTVRVLRLYGLPRAGEQGTVCKVWLDGGELAVSVTFDDGTEETYNERELEDLRNPKWSTRNQAGHGD